MFPVSPAGKQTQVLTTAQNSWPLQHILKQTSAYPH